MPQEADALSPNTTTNARQLQRELRAELEDAGLAWGSLKRTLPDWVDSAFESRSGVLELKTFLSRNVGLRLSREGKLAASELPAACFKTNAATSVDQVMAARAVASACGRLVAKATLTPYSRLPADADLFRSSVLGAVNKPWIDLSTLIHACWKHGIPVIYLPALPVVGRKMEGMVTNVGGRPVIVLTKKVPHPDWLLFLLAHEIGHLAAGHLPDGEGQAIVDDTVELAPGNDRDQQEREANSFATHLLAPNGMEVRFEGRLPNAANLAAQAQQYGADHGMSPGYVILNAVHNSLIGGRKPFALGQAALKLLPADGERTAGETCKAALHEYVDADMLRSDSVEFLEKLELL